MICAVLTEPGDCAENDRVAEGSLKLAMNTVAPVIVPDVEGVQLSNTYNPVPVAVTVVPSMMTVFPDMV